MRVKDIKKNINLIDKSSGACWFFFKLRLSKWKEKEDDQKNIQESDDGRKIP